MNKCFYNPKNRLQITYKDSKGRKFQFSTS